MQHHEARHTHVALTDDERHAVTALAREALRAAADAPSPAEALAWAERACAALRAVAADDLATAGRLYDRAPSGAPFDERWRGVTAPIAARAEAMLLLDVERDIEEVADHLARP